MSIGYFKKKIFEKNPEELLDEWFNETNVEACSSGHYQEFCGIVEGYFRDVQKVKIMGSGNWGYSLNPKKIFSQFNEKSDIDTVIITKTEFDQTWEELRKYHREKWYMLSGYHKTKLKRNGENIYSGFASPLWIPEIKNEYRFSFIKAITTIPGCLIGYRTVNMLFFKNYDEVLDYYKRGIMIARRMLDNGI